MTEPIIKMKAPVGVGDIRTKNGDKVIVGATGYINVPPSQCIDMLNSGCIPIIVSSGWVTPQDAATIVIDAALGTFFRVGLPGNRTLGNPINLTPGQELTIMLVNNAPGNHTLAYGSMWKFAGGVNTISTGSNAVDVIKAFYDGTTSMRAILNRGYV